MMNAVEMIRRCVERQQSGESQDDVLRRVVARRVLNVPPTERILPYDPVPIPEPPSLVAVFGVILAGMVFLCGLIRAAVWVIWGV